jgi:hypothetical protein
LPKIDENTLARILTEFEQFKAFITEYIDDFALRGARLFPKYSVSRLKDAHHFWTQDIQRISKFSLNGKTPDHFKQAAHLTYWLRRSGPVIDYLDAINPQDGVAEPPTAQENAVRDLLFNYSSEYLAFDLGYQVCRFYELGRLPVGAHPPAFDIDMDYILTMCCFLKEKNVSPHALYLTFKSLFYKRFAS